MYNGKVNIVDFSEIKAVAFDIDGTLYRTWRFNIRMPVHFFGHLYFFSQYGLVRRKMRKVEANSSDLIKLQAEMMGKRLFCSPEKAQVHLDKIVYTGLEKMFKKIRPCKGSVEFVKKLKDSGYKIGILSDFPPEQKGNIWGIKDLCDVVLGSEAAGALKPSPVPFLKLAEKLGVKPEQILYVGNNHKYDILGAKNTGMKTAWIKVPGIFKKKSDVADVTFYHYKELDKVFFGSVNKTKTLGVEPN